MSDKHTQYSVRDGGFIAVGKTFDTLPDGMYSVEGTFFGPILKQMSVDHDELVDIGDTEASIIISEIDRFWSVADRFHKLGMMHKRGFLMHGPPGTGKTSITNIIADAMVKRGVLVVYPRSDANDLSEMLASVRNIERERNIVVIIEDIDRFLNMGEEQLLSLLDGQSSIDRVVFVATTNYIDELPDRISKRPSRFDRVIEVAPPSAALRRHFVSQKFPKMSKSELDTWTRKTKGLSLAHIKELIVSVGVFDGDLTSEVARLRDASMEETEFEKSDVETDG